MQIHAKSSEKVRSSKHQVRLIDRVVRILEALSPEDSGLALVELSEHLGLHKSTVHRLLVALERYRFVERTPVNGKYRLGVKLFELGSRAAAHLDLRERARPYLNRLAFEIGETAHLGILDEGEVLYLDKVEPSRPVRMSSRIGGRKPAHATAMGKVMLSALSDEEVDDLIKKCGLKSLTRNTITTPVALKRELELTKQRSFATDDEENDEGVACVAAALRDYSGKVVAAISISGPAFRLPPEKIPFVAKTVVAVAEELSKELGYSGSQKELRSTVGHRS